jgi:hypothetical protein
MSDLRSNQHGSGSNILDAARPHTAPLAALTPPSPVLLVKETHYYALAERAASMHRHDGTRLAFMFGICATNNQADINYLENELYLGHASLSRATPEQVAAYKMRVDPRGAIEAEMRPHLESKIRGELEEKIRLEREATERQGKHFPTDDEKLGRTDTMEARLARLRAGTTSGTGTVFMESKAAPLSGIVGSDKLAGGQSDSASGMQGTNFIPAAKS